MGRGLGFAGFWLVEPLVVRLTKLPVVVIVEAEEHGPRNQLLAQHDRRMTGVVCAVRAVGRK